MSNPIISNLGTPGGYKLLASGLRKAQAPPATRTAMRRDSGRIGVERETPPDEEHEMVVNYHKKNQEYHEKYIKLVKEVSQLNSESDAKHQKYIETRQKADEMHQKAMKMRGKVIAIKKERRSRYKEKQDAIEEQNVKARQLLEKQDEAVDNEIKKLKEQGKISLGV